MDIETKAVLAQYTHPGRVKRLGVSDENTFYAACENATVRCYQFIGSYLVSVSL